MHRISIALSVLISREQYRLQATSKVTKTETDHVGYYFAEIADEV